MNSGAFAFNEDAYNIGIRLINSANIIARWRCIFMSPSRPPFLTNNRTASMFTRPLVSTPSSSILAQYLHGKTHTHTEYTGLFYTGGQSGGRAGGQANEMMLSDVSFVARRPILCLCLSIISRNMFVLNNIRHHSHSRRRATLERSSMHAFFEPVAHN